MSEGAVLLEVRDVHVHYGSVEAVRGVSFALHQGESLAIIGANGAGKTSLLNAIARVVPSTGTMTLLDRGLPRQPHRVVQRGIALVPEGRRVFPRLTVMENLQAGAYLRRSQEMRADLETVWTLFPRLKDRVRQLAGTLSGGEQQMLAIARGLMSRPRALLVDEPSLGLSPRLSAEVMQSLAGMSEQLDTSVLIVEQNAPLALSVTDRVLVMAGGKVMLEGRSAEMATNNEVEALYLGT